MTEGKLELIKGQCGRHSINEMAKFFTLSKATLMRRIAKLKIKFPKSPFGSPCHFCKIENNTNKEKEEKSKKLFKCVICSKKFDRKEKLRRHMSSVHDDKSLLNVKFAHSTLLEKLI